MRISDWSSDVCSSDFYVQGDGSPATAYPANPNGSADAIAGLSSEDGRATILMPHPERTPRKANLSWAPDDWPDDSPWLRMFSNARIRMDWVARSPNGSTRKPGIASWRAFSLCAAGDDDASRSEERRVGKKC